MLRTVQCRSTEIIFSSFVSVAFVWGAFMGALSRAAGIPATEIVRPDDRLTDQLAGSVLSEIARTLWPTNTAANIASVCGCGVRAAERYLGGQREWSGDAIAAIVTEILKRHQMRNVRIAARR